MRGPLLWAEGGREKLKEKRCWTEPLLDTQLEPHVYCSLCPQAPRARPPTPHPLNSQPVPSSTMGAEYVTWEHPKEGWGTR